MEGQLALKHPYGQEPNKRVWPLKIENGNVIIRFEDLADALEIMRGSYIHRLEIQQLNDKMLRTSEHLQQALTTPIPPTQPQ